MQLNKLVFALLVAAGMSTGAQAASCKAGDSYSNTTVDCGGATIGLSCKGDSETQPAVLTLNNATVKNVTISATGASDGIHCVGGTCTLINVKWLEVCEDAASVIADNAKMVVTGGSAVNTATTDNAKGGKPDKFFQINNANTSLTINGGFTATIAAGDISGSVGKLARSCGDCTTNLGPRTINVSNVTVKGKIGSIVGVNSQYRDANKKIISGRHDTATIRSLKVEGYKVSSTTLDTGGNKTTPAICDQYEGVQKGKGSSAKVGDGQAWNTTSCNVSMSDVSAL
ncbi:pectate lyase [Viridibacterium curvum]|uniref:Pectate lyase n=1 Tax=Viridibacterium curvum TaxID=1101404 RepID=A0ABP9QH26_9RHOO